MFFDVTFQNCRKIAVDLYPGLVFSFMDKCFLQIVQSSLMLVMMQTATFNRN